ncbi:MAG: HAD family hydrolase [Phycisphaeraceae bacterium]|nr:HAD family hydrolase [Phycisphaeraceae bacterium]
MRYKAVFLDFYGTLVDEDDVIIDQIVRQITAESPCLCTSAQVLSSWRFAELCHDSFGSSFKCQRELELQSLQALLDQHQVNLNAAVLSAELFAYWRAPPVVPGASSFLNKLTIPTCLVSNIDNVDLDCAIRHHGWRFDAVVTSEQCRAYKPRPEPFLMALKLMDVGPQEVVHIGDSFRADILGASSLGIATIWINRKRRGLPTGVNNPTHTVSHIGEAFEFLQ